MSLSLAETPDEVIYEILSCLHIQELLRLAVTSTRMLQLCHDDNLWKALAAKIFTKVQPTPDQRWSAMVKDLSQYRLIPISYTIIRKDGCRRNKREGKALVKITKATTLGQLHSLMLKLPFALATTNFTKPIPLSLMEKINPSLHQISTSATAVILSGINIHQLVLILEKDGAIYLKGIDLSIKVVDPTALTTRDLINRSEDMLISRYPILGRSLYDKISLFTVVYYLK